MTRLIIILLIWLAAGVGARADVCVPPVKPWRVVLTELHYGDTQMQACEAAALFMHELNPEGGVYVDLELTGAQCVIGVYGTTPIFYLDFEDMGCTAPDPDPDPDSEGDATVICEGTCTVTLSITPAPASAENVADYYELMMLMTLGLVVLWGIKKILQIFDNHHEA